MDCTFDGGKLTIVREGSLIKFVRRLQQVSYNGKFAREKGQKMHYVTERAVFELTKDGSILTEIANGVDLQTQILDLMEFRPVISKNLRIIDPCIYQNGPFGLKQYLTTH